MTVKTLMTALADLAASIILETMDRHLVGEKDFRKSRFPHHVMARADAIRKLRDAGFSIAQIARFLGKEEKTITSQLHPEIRARRNAARKRRYEAAKQRAEARA